MKQLFLFSVVMVMSTGIAACSVKASDVGDSTFHGPPPQKKVQGPDLSGTWASGCQRSGFGENKSFDVVYTTNTLSRKSTTYTDTDCATVQDSKTENGTYIFLETNKDGSYTVQYSIPIGNGVTALPQEKVLLDNGVLYLSDYAIGDAVTKQMMVPLRKVPAGKVR